MLSDKSIASYYRLIFGLAQHHKYNIGDLENIYPFEMDIYTSFLVEYLKEQEKELKKNGR